MRDERGATMRPFTRCLGLLVGLGLITGPAVPALAQSTAPTAPATTVAPDAGAAAGAIQDQPLPPPPNTSESNLLGPGSQQAPAPMTVPPAPEPPPGTHNPMVPAPTAWVAKTSADLLILDKIYGSSKRMTATVGTPFAVRFLTVTVLACWVRPPNMPPDAAAFVQVVDTHAPAGSPPEFKGWIFEAEPALSGVSDSATDISLTGCH